MVVLLPRLPGPAAEVLFAQRMADGFAERFVFSPGELPEAVRFAATGGTRVAPNQLSALRTRILETARRSGFGSTGGRAGFAQFDADMAAAITEDPLFASGEALRDDVWAFVGLSIAPDIVQWRFGNSRERYLGGVRNTFQRLWMRGHALDRGADHQNRWHLLKELTEDALVQITERPSLGGDPVLARAIAETWIRAAGHHGKGAMEPIMRRAALQIRIRNEIRSLADLPPDHLAAVLDDAFGLPVAARDTVVTEFGKTGIEEDQAIDLPESIDDEADPSQTQEFEESNGEPNHSVHLAAARVLGEARRRHWVSPKSFRALNVLMQGQGELNSRERNSLNHLLSRMRSADLLHSEISRLTEAVTVERPHRP